MGDSFKRYYVYRTHDECDVKDMAVASFDNYEEALKYREALQIAAIESGDTQAQFKLEFGD